MSTVKRSRATVNQCATESDSHYIIRAKRYAAYRFAIHRESIDYRYAHPSHAAAQALRDAQLRFVDLGTFGAEGYCSDDQSFAFQYLNTGDQYDLTVCYQNGKFFAGCWGDIVENHNNSE